MINLFTLAEDIVYPFTETMARWLTYINMPLNDLVRDVLNLEWLPILPNETGLLGWLMGQSLVELTLGYGLLAVIVYLAIKAFIPTT